MHFLQVALFENKAAQNAQKSFFCCTICIYVCTVPDQREEQSNKTAKCFLASLEPTLRNCGRLCIFWEISSNLWKALTGTPPQENMPKKKLKEKTIF